MFDLKDLYREVIVDHNRSPRNWGRLARPSHSAEGYNPLCGDRLAVDLEVDDAGVIRNVAFEGQGCAVSVASASLMTEALRDRPLADAERLFRGFHDLLTGSAPSGAEEESLGKLMALAGVRDYPARVKCATLCWHALHSALEGRREASTE